MSNIVKKEPAHQVVQNFDLTNVNDLAAWLNMPPRKLEPLKAAPGKFQVPISVLETDLTYLTGPLGWRVIHEKTVSWGQVGTDKNGNVLVGVEKIVHVEYLHPIFKEMWRTSGSATAFASLGTLNTAGGRVASLAFKNAVKRLGRRFGADLNRELEDDVDVWEPDPIDLTAITNLDELVDTYKNMPRHEQEIHKAAFHARKVELSNSKKP